MFPGDWVDAQTVGEEPRICSGKPTPAQQLFSHFVGRPAPNNGIVADLVCGGWCHREINLETGDERWKCLVCGEVQGDE